MKDSAIHQRIVDKIKDPILLVSISFGLIVSGLGVYSLDKLSKLIVPLLIVYVVGLLAAIIRGYRKSIHPVVTTEVVEKPDKPCRKRKDLLEDWIDIIQDSETLTIVNGISRRYIIDPPIMSKFKKYLDNCQKATIIWDSNFNQATRFFQIKESDEDYEFVDLIQHLDNKIEDTLKAFCKLKSDNQSIKIKVLPFAVSYTFLKTDEGIYVSLLGAVRGSNAPTKFISKSDTELFDYFQSMIENLELLSADVEYDFNKQEFQISEFLQLVDKRGNLLTTLPRKFIEGLNFKINITERKNLAHRHVYCMVISPEGKILIQRRGKERDNGELWDKSVGGHVQYGETMAGACIREVKEELGVEVNLDQHRLSLIERQVEPIELKRLLYKDGEYVDSIEYSSYELFLLYGVHEDEVRINKIEVLDYCWVDINNVDEFINQNREKTTEDLKRLAHSIPKILHNMSMHLDVNFGGADT